MLVAMGFHGYGCGSPVGDHKFAHEIPMPIGFKQGCEELLFLFHYYLVMVGSLFSVGRGKCKYKRERSCY